MILYQLHTLLNIEWGMITNDEMETM